VEPRRAEAATKALANRLFACDVVLICGPLDVGCKTVDPERHVRDEYQAAPEQE
jgi:hypothetical protein